MNYMCPVCGYPELDEKPSNHEICPSCGTQFGYDDYLRSHEAIRQQWLNSGAEWFLKGYEPYGWNAFTQLRSAGFLKIQEESNTSSASGTANRKSQEFEIIEFDSGDIDTKWVVFGNSSIGLGRVSTN